MGAHERHPPIGRHGRRPLVPWLLGRDCPQASAAPAMRYWELPDDARALPAAADLLRHLHDRGVAVVLATSSLDGELAAAVRLLGTDDAIDAKTTADDVERSKRAPDVFAAALKAGAVDPARALAMGDTIWDIQSARAAGIGCIGVETGGFSQHELSGAGALHVHRMSKSS